MSDQDDVPGPNDFDITARLSVAVRDAEAVQKRLRVIMEGADNDVISGELNRGLEAHALMFKGVSRSYGNSVARVSRVSALLQRVPLDRMERIPRFPPEEIVDISRNAQVLEFIDVNLSASDKVLSLLTNGSLSNLMFQVQAIEQAQRIVLGIGGSNLTLAGYSKALSLDVIGIFLPIVGQLKYVMETMLRSELALLKEMKREASTVGKALKFCQFVGQANAVMEEYTKVFDAGEQLLSEFVDRRLPMALDELGV